MIIHKQIRKKKYMKKNKILNNVSSLMIFNIAKMVFPFITLPYLTRILSTDTYGIVAYVKTVMSYMQILVDFGFVLSGTKDIVDTRNDKEKIGYVVGDTLLAKIMMSGIAFLILFFLIIALPLLRSNVEYTLLSFVVVFESIFLMDFLFRGMEIMHVITIRFILMKAISTMLTFALVKGDDNILLIPLFDILGSFIAVLLVMFEIKKLKIKVNFHGIRNAIQLIKNAFVYFLSNIASTLFNTLSTLIIGLKITATEVAYWSVCMQIITSITACYTPISDGLYPEMIKNKDINLIKKALKYLMPVVIIGCTLAYFLAGFGMMILGGEKYLAAVPIFRLLIPILLFGLPIVLLGWPALGAIGKTKEVTTATVISVIIHIVLLLILVITDSFTLVNIAIVRTLTEILLFIIRYSFYRKYKHLFSKKNLVK